MGSIPNSSDLVKIQAVIVLYKSTLKESLTFQSLSKSLMELRPTANLSLFVYDNSPLKQEISDTDSDFWNISYYHDSGNAGVSKSYNKGAEFAAKNHKDWLLVLDQDTIFPLNAIEEYLKAISPEEFGGQGLFCPVLISGDTIVSPCKLRFYRGLPLKHLPLPGEFDLESLKPINSGLLVNLIAFQNAGGYNELIKLDFSDFEFIERFKNINSKGIILPLRCQHGLSSYSIIDMNSALLRFNYYISGARVMEKDLSSAVKIETLLLLRALKLSLRYKSTRFLSSLFS